MHLDHIHQPPTPVADVEVPLLCRPGSLDHHRRRRLRDLLVGLVLIVVDVVLWVSSGIITQRIYGALAYDDPLVLTYVTTASFSLFHLPALWTPEKPSSSSSSSSIESGITPKKTRILSAKFTPIWLAMGFLYNWSLSCTTLSSGTVLSSTSGVFTLFIGRALVGRPISIIKLVGVALAVVGAGIVSTRDSSSPSPGSIMGDTAALMSAAMTGFYTVTLVHSVGKEHRRFCVQHFLGWMGQYALWLGMPILAMMHMAGLHVIARPSLSAVAALLVNAAVSVLSDLFWVKAMLLTSPLIATVGMSTTIPLAIVCDLCLNARSPSLPYLIGSCLVLISFVAINVEYVNDIGRHDGDDEQQQFANIAGC